MKSLLGMVGFPAVFITNNSLCEGEEFITMVESTTYQAQRQQLLLTGATVFSAIVAAVIVSTIVVSQIVQGQLASALSSQVTAPAPVTTVAGTCVDTSTQAASTAAVAKEAPVHTGEHAHPYTMAALGAATVHDAFNSTTTVNNNTTTTTNNNETHTNTTTVETTIRDSFNDGSYNDNRDQSVSVDGNTLNLNSNNTSQNQQSWTNNQTTNTTTTTVTDNSNNSVNNSGNTTSATNNQTTNTTNVVNSGNTANLLSGNNVPVLVRL